MAHFPFSSPNPPAQSLPALGPAPSRPAPRSAQPFLARGPASTHGPAHPRARPEPKPACPPRLPAHPDPHVDARRAPTPVSLRPGPACHPSPSAYLAAQQSPAAIPAALPSLLPRRDPRPLPFKHPADPCAPPIHPRRPRTLAAAAATRSSKQNHPPPPVSFSPHEFLPPALLWPR